MADGDPMVFKHLFGVPRDQTSNYQSLLSNGPIEEWTDTASYPDGWDWAKSHQVAEPTHARVAGTRTGGVGSYIYRQTYASEQAGDQLGAFTQKIILPDNQWDANGFMNMTLVSKLWARNTGGGTVHANVTIQGLDNTGAFVQWGNPNVLYLTGSWQSVGETGFTITDSDVAQIYFSCIMGTDTAGAPVVELDEAELYATYTFDRNPTVTSSESSLSVPHRRLKRTVGGHLYVARPDDQSPKIRRVLTFSGIAYAQVEKLRHFWMLDRPFVWEPNEPNLPSAVDVRMVDRDFRFRLMRVGWAADKYSGKITLEEV